MVEEEGKSKGRFTGRIDQVIRGRGRGCWDDKGWTRISFFFFSLFVDNSRGWIVEG